MKQRGAIKHALNECQLSREENELWDGEPDMYINQGWIEALEYVLNIKGEEKYFQLGATYNYISNKKKVNIELNYKTI